MKRYRIWFSLLALCLCMWPRASARAATCTLQGTIRVESMDTYYCDTDILGAGGCNSWIETNLDSKSGTSAPPLKNALLLLSKDGALLSSAVTSNTGGYAFQFQSPSCSGITMRVHIYFDRRDPNDVGKGTFRLVDDSNLTLSTTRDFTLSGTPATRDITFNRANTASLIARAPSVYHTANSAIDQIRTWSTNLSNRFKATPSNDGNGSMRIRFSSSVTSTATNWPQWMFDLEPQQFSAGGSIRHEIGHLVHYALHNRLITSTCFSYKLNTYTNDSHPADGCEYGHVASMEGLATFFAARSIRTDDGNDAIYCQCWWRDETDASAPANQDVCSEMVAGVAADSDRMGGCFNGGGPVAGLGDNFATTTSHCIRLRAGLNTGQSGKGCACPDLNFDGFCDFNINNLPQVCPDTNSDGFCDTNARIALGFRNEWNIARFMWDVIDGNNEAGQDDTNETIGTVASAFQGMPCSAGNGGLGQNGDCNEAQPPPGWCQPSNDGDFFTGSMTGTRDAYNPADFENIIQLDQASERTINCVAGAN